MSTLSNITSVDLHESQALEAQMLPQAQHLEDLIGNTPLIHLPQLTAHLSSEVSIYAKAEWANPGGSIKDRPALNIIREAERRGELRPGLTLLDSTSGNMGIAYAMIGTARGYRVSLVVPANASPERLAILRAYGVDLILSDPTEGSDGAIRRVKELFEADPQQYFYADQYNNSDNWQAHYKTTAVEIWEQTQGQVTHFVAGLGTSGTLTGISRRLREYREDVQIIALQPDSPFHGLEGLKHMPTAIKPGIYDESVADQNLPIRTEDAHQMCRRMARELGLLIGVSAGAALVGAVQIAESTPRGVIVTVLPDSAARYLSESFWDAGEEAQ
jgi:cysteine synthase B